MSEDEPQPTPLAITYYFPVNVPPEPRFAEFQF